MKRPPKIDGLNVDEFIRRNAAPIWLHQNEMWEYLHEQQEMQKDIYADEELQEFDGDEMIPF